MDVEKDHEITLYHKDTNSEMYQVALQMAKHGCGKGPWDHFIWQGHSPQEEQGSTGEG